MTTERGRKLLCPWCTVRFDGQRCPTCQWDARYGSVKAGRGCIHRDCREPAAWRDLDPYRPIEYRAEWCDTHLPTTHNYRNQVEALA